MNTLKKLHQRTLKTPLLLWTVGMCLSCLYLSACSSDADCPVSEEYRPLVSRVGESMPFDESYYSSEGGPAHPAHFATPNWEAKELIIVSENQFQLKFVHDGKTIIETYKVLDRSGAPPL